MLRDEMLEVMRQDAGGDEPESPAAPGDVVSLGDRLRVLRDELDALDEQRKVLQGEYDRIRTHDLPSAMARAGLVNDSGQGKFSLSDGSTVYLRTDIRTHLRKADEGAFHNWLRGNGHGDLIREAVHPSTLRAWVREQVESGQPVPEYVSQYHETAAAIRRS